MTQKPRPIRERESAAASAAPPASAGGQSRPDGRSPRQVRPLKIERGVLPTAEGSALVIMGRTRVLCTATIEDRLPGWLRGKGGGWVTAEYGMLPRATRERTPRAAQAGGRTHEIQRLIGRSLRAVTDLKVFGERTILLDCDVLEADAGTRTAAINGAFVALHDAFVKLSNDGRLLRPPLRDTVAAISVGIVAGLRRDALVTSLLTAHAAGVVLVVAMTSGNVGTLIRHRGLAMPYIVWVAIFGGCALITRALRAPRPVSEGMGHDGDR